MSPVAGIALAISVVSFAISLSSMVLTKRLRRQRDAAVRQHFQALESIRAARTILEEHQAYLESMMDGTNDYTSASAHLQSLIDSYIRESTKTEEKSADASS